MSSFFWWGGGICFLFATIVFMNQDMCAKQTRRIGIMVHLWFVSLHLHRLGMIGDLRLDRDSRRSVLASNPQDHLRHLMKLILFQQRERCILLQVSWRPWVFWSLCEFKNMIDLDNMYNYCIRELTDSDRYNDILYIIDTHILMQTIMVKPMNINRRRCRCLSPLRKWCRCGRP